MHITLGGVVFVVASTPFFLKKLIRLSYFYGICVFVCFSFRKLFFVKFSSSVFLDTSTFSRHKSMFFLIKWSQIPRQLLPQDLRLAGRLSVLKEDQGRSMSMSGDFFGGYDEAYKASLKWPPNEMKHAHVKPCMNLNSKVRGIMDYNPDVARYSFPDLDLRLSF